LNKDIFVGLERSLPPFGEVKLEGFSFDADVLNRWLEHAVQALGANLSHSTLAVLTVHLANLTNFASNELLARLILKSDFMEEILNAVGFLPVSDKLAQQPKLVLFPAINLPYEILFRISFIRQLSLYHEGDHDYIKTSSGVRVATPGNGKRAEFEYALLRGRKFLSQSCKTILGSRMRGRI
jgi:hypothetical protein